MLPEEEGMEYSVAAWDPHKPFLFEMVAAWLVWSPDDSNELYPQCTTHCFLKKSLIQMLIVIKTEYNES